MSPNPAASGRQMTVVALCAEWCGTCREFRPMFEAVAAAMPAVRFIWVDIEEEPDVAGDMEIAVFPTLGVMRGDVPLHFGPTLPQRAALERLLRGISQNAAPGVVSAEAAQAMLRAVQHDR